MQIERFRHIHEHLRHVCHRATGKMAATHSNRKEADMKRATLTAVLFLATAAAIPAAHPAQAADMKLWRLDCGTIQVNDLSLFSDDFDYVGPTAAI
jgi:hypothetical protein